MLTAEQLKEVLKENVINLRFHARGGQGGVTAAQLVVYAYDGPAKCFPRFGAERMGSPTEAYTKVSQDPDAIRSNEQVYAPRYVCILDDTIINDICVTNGLPPGGWLIINTVKNLNALKELTGRDDVNYALIDATSLAIEMLGRPITNTAILGAFSRATGLVNITAVERAIEEYVPLKKKENKQAARDAYEQVIQG